MSGAIPLGLYLHFPWCVSKCPYCDFNSHALREDVPGRDVVPEAAYIESLQRDLAHQLETQAALIGDRRIDSIFMGGGTPSLFSPAAIGRLLEFVERSIGIAPQAEITLEANPGTIERGRFDIVLANILANPLKILAPALLARVAAGGWLVLSGILARQADEMIALYARVDPDLPLQVWRSEDGWVCLAGQRR